MLLLVLIINVRVVGRRLVDATCWWICIRYHHHPTYARNAAIMRLHYIIMFVPEEEEEAEISVSSQT